MGSTRMKREPHQFGASVTGRVWGERPAILKSGDGGPEARGATGGGYPQLPTTRRLGLSTAELVARLKREFAQARERVLALSA